MSEKVIGIKVSTRIQSITANNEKVWVAFEKDLVPVVSIEWLEKYVTHIRSCFEKNQPSDFEAGEETGRIEGLEVLLAEAKKEAGKR